MHTLHHRHVRCGAALRRQQQRTHHVQLSPRAQAAPENYRRLSTEQIIARQASLRQQRAPWLTKGRPGPQNGNDSQVQQHHLGSEHAKQASSNGSRHHSNGSSNGGRHHSNGTGNGVSAAALAQQQKQAPGEGGMVNFPFTMHQLLALKAVDSAGSMDKAAELLGVTKANVSMLLSKLEKEFQQQLMIRAKGAVPQPTPAGALLLRYADRMIAFCCDATAAAKDLQELRSGTMTVAASQTTGVYLMPSLIEKYKRTHPHVSVQLQVENTRRCCAAVVKGNVDIAVVGGAVPNDLAHTVQVTPYQDDEVVIICPKLHPLSGHKEIDPEQLQDLQWVSLFSSSTVQAIKATLEHRGINWKALKVVLEVNSVEAIKNAVEANLGVAFVSLVAVRKEVALGSVRVLRIRGLPLIRSLRCVTDPVRYCSRAVQAFIREMFGLTITTSSEGCFVGSSGRQTGLPALPRGIEHEPSRQLNFDQLSRQTWGNGQADSQALGSADANAHWVAGRPRSQADASTAVAMPEDRIAFSLNQVAVFLAVARTGNLTSAASELGISQPAVSKSLHSLEQVLGTPLISRRQGPAWLTDGGRALHPYCSSIVTVAGQACKAMQDFRAAKSGVVSLGASQTVGTYVMPRLVAAFKKLNPQVSVQLQVDKSRAICQSVMTGEVDIAIVGGDVPADLQDTLQAMPYAQDELVLIVPADHELVGRGVADKATLYRLSFVALHAGNTAQAAQEALLRSQGVEYQHLHVDMELNSIEAIKSAVHCGLGVAFVSASAIEKELELGMVAKINVQGLRLIRTLQLVSNPRRDYPRLAQRFMVEVFNIKTDAEGRPAAAQGRAQALQHTSIAPRPWEQHTTAAATAGDKPILQLAQYPPNV